MPAFKRALDFSYFTPGGHRQHGWNAGTVLAKNILQRRCEMGWLFRSGATRKCLIDERTRDWERTTEAGVTVTTTCLAHCYRGGIFSGVLWAVWERQFRKDGVESEPSERWITCDLLRHEGDSGWGYKDLDESMGPFSYSCPLTYLDLVPLDRFGGNAHWRESVKSYHARQKEKRRRRVTV